MMTDGADLHAAAIVLGDGPQLPGAARFEEVGIDDGSLQRPWIGPVVPQSPPYVADGISGADESVALVPWPEHAEPVDTQPHDDDEYGRVTNPGRYL